MGARSFATARLMETWAHGQDVADALDATREPTARLRHVAHIGVLARPFAYATRGMQVPERDVRVELAAPDGSTWTWGPEDAADVVRGDALDFCLVVTQRRHPADTALVVEGPGGRGVDGHRPGLRRAARPGPSAGPVRLLTSRRLDVLRRVPATVAS